MAKVWVLDTATKGTGAEVVPYEKTLRRPGREPELALVSLGGSPPAAKEDPPPAPSRFKVEDLMGARVLAEDVGLRAAIEALGALRSVLDARVFVWSPERARWRLLT